jgi:hypothetical protein
MVGAVGLTLKRPVAAPDYDVFAQHYVDFQKGLVEIKNKLHFLSTFFIYIFYLHFLSMRTEMKKLRGS